MSMESLDRRAFVRETPLYAFLRGFQAGLLDVHNMWDEREMENAPEEHMGTGTRALRNELVSLLDVPVGESLLPYAKSHLPHEYAELERLVEKGLQVRNSHKKLSLALVGNTDQEAEKAYVNAMNVLGQKAQIVVEHVYEHMRNEFMVNMLDV